MSIPIYNNHRNRINVERAQLNVINREIGNEQLRQQLKTNIDRAIADARAAKRSYEAATTAVEASTASYRNAQTRYDVGAVNSLELQTARNAMEQAKIDLVRARYQYIFNLKLVEFYQGKPLTLN
jgi:outer membrane protein